MRVHAPEPYPKAVTLGRDFSRPTLLSGKRTETGIRAIGICHCYRHKQGRPNTLSAIRSETHRVHVSEPSQVDRRRLVGPIATDLAEPPLDDEDSDRVRHRYGRCGREQLDDDPCER